MPEREHRGGMKTVSACRKSTHRAGVCVTEQQTDACNASENPLIKRIQLKTTSPIISHYS